MKADLPLVAKAFLDAVAWGESDPRMTGGNYDILFGGSRIVPGMQLDDTGFPMWDGIRVRNGAITHAAGRYQFQPATWHGMVAAKAAELPELPNGQAFGGDDVQDFLAWELAKADYRRRTGTRSLKDDLRAADPGRLAAIAQALQPTWTSLDPGLFPKRYGARMAFWRAESNKTTAEPVQATVAPSDGAAEAPSAWRENTHAQPSGASAAWGGAAAFCDAAQLASVPPTPTMSPAELASVGRYLRVIARELNAAADRLDPPAQG